jgi:hypothetical protein
LIGIIERLHQPGRTTKGLSDRAGWTSMPAGVFHVRYWRKRTSASTQLMSAFGGKATSGGGRFSFTCVLSASRGHAVEMPSISCPNALNGSAADGM